MGKKSEWINVYTFPGPNYAEMVTEVLKERKIPFLLKTAPLVSAYFGAGTSTFQMDTKLFVPEDRKEEVLDLIHMMLDHI